MYRVKIHYFHSPSLGFSIGCCGEVVQKIVRKKINALGVKSRTGDMMLLAESRFA